MSFKDIQEKLLAGADINKLLNQIDSEPYNKSSNLIKSYSELAGDLKNIQAELLKAGYKAGVIDTIQKIKEAGITEFDLIKYDLSDIDFTESDKKEFDRLKKELDQLDTKEVFKDFS